MIYFSTQSSRVFRYLHRPDRVRHFIRASLMNRCWCTNRRAERTDACTASIAACCALALESRSFVCSVCDGLKERKAAVSACRLTRFSGHQIRCCACLSAARSALIGPAVNTGSSFRQAGSGPGTVIRLFVAKRPLRPSAVASNVDCSTRPALHWVCRGAMLTTCSSAGCRTRLR
jgi:hypothetical protein